MFVAVQIKAAFLYFIMCLEKLQMQMKSESFWTLF